MDAFASINDVYSNFVEKRGGHLTAGGRVGDFYVSFLDQILDMCHPEKVQENLHAKFAGRSIDFIIYGKSTEYSKEIDSNIDFADFAKEWPYIFNPVVGYIEIASPETVDYAEAMMTRFKQNHIIIDEPDVRFKGGRGVCEQLKIAKKYWNY
ncbi:MAG: hypothetical protein KAS90_00165 [Candidatus Aenigmarchaeota archaeon]|nr:hypothetical protein [Candidatus Aenigmarchaeota archaeon]